MAVTSFAPLLGEKPHTLVLGSMPSQVSLRKREYYAHPRNAFWWLMGELIGFDYKLPYHARIAEIEQSGFAVWDVLLDCQRDGSLDSNIQRDSEQCNDFSTLFEKISSFKLIAFNGTASQTIFMRHCAEVLEQFPNLSTVLLPSSSPAYASVSKYEKLQLWRQRLPELSKVTQVAADHG